MELKKKAALITGASRGIGAATAIKLAGEGCHVAVNCHRSVELAKQVAKKCCELGVKAIVVQGDVAIDDHCRRIVSESTHILGGLDILINTIDYLYCIGFCFNDRDNEIYFSLYFSNGSQFRACIYCCIMFYIISILPSFET